MDLIDWITVVVVASYLNGAQRVPLYYVSVLFAFRFIGYVIGLVLNSKPPPPMVRSNWE